MSGQPSELLKVILVVFLAGYLSENRSLLADESTRIGPIRLPPIPYLAPMVAMWAIALVIVVVQRDLGAALLFFAVFLAMLYVATGRPSYVVGGLLLFVAGSCVLYNLFGHVQQRVDNWLDPFRDPLGAGFQTVQALYAFARGGLLGVGLGAGLPTIGGDLPIPAVHTDYPLAALGEELGLIGLLAILGLYLVVVERGLRIAAAAHDDFRALLAAGLALVVGVQAFIIAAGNLKLIPLTGITLPLISYGGSSLLANARRHRAAARPVRPGRRAAAGARRSPDERGTGAPHDRRQHLADRRRARRVVRDPRRRCRLVAGRRRAAALARARQPRGHRRGPSRPPRPDRRPRRPLARAQRARQERRGRPRVPRRLDQPRRRLRVAPVRNGRPRAHVQRRAHRPRRRGPFGGLLDKFDATRRQPLGLQTTLDLRLQRAAVDGLGSDRGAVVMLDPTTGDVLALASTPTFDAGAIADPDTASAAFDGAPGRRRATRCCPRATLGRYVPGSVFKIVTAIAGLNTGSISADTTFPQQPKAEKKGLLVDGYRIRDGHHPQTGDTALDLVGATEVSCNIWYALAGLATGGDKLVDQAALLGFGAPIPFDLPTAGQPRHRRRRSRARWLRRRRRARVRVVRPGRDVRHPAPDGARGVDRRRTTACSCSRAS